MADSGGNHNRTHLDPEGETPRDLSGKCSESADPASFGDQDFKRSIANEIVLLETEVPEQLSRVVATIQEKVAPGREVVVVCQAERLSHFREMGGIVQVVSYRRRSVFERLRLIWGMRRNRSEVLCGVFSDRPLFWFHRLLFFLARAKQRVVFNENLDCYFTGRGDLWRLFRSTLLQAISGGRSGELSRHPRIVLFDHHCPDLPEEAVERLKAPGLFPGAEVIRLSRIAGLEPSEESRGKPAIRRVLDQVGIDYLCLPFTSARIPFSVRLSFLLAKSPRKLVLLPDLKCQPLFLCIWLKVLIGRVVPSADKPGPLELDGLTGEELEWQLAEKTEQDLNRLLFYDLIKRLRPSSADGPPSIQESVLAVASELLSRRALFKFPAVYSRILNAEEMERIENQIQQLRVVLDSSRHQVNLGGRILELEPSSFRMLEILVESAGTDIPRNRILDLSHTVPSDLESALESLSSLLLEAPEFWERLQCSPLSWNEQSVRLNLRLRQVVRKSLFGELIELPETAWIVDLGSGQGTFDYASTPARVLALDLAFSKKIPTATGCVIADAEALPLRREAVDLVMCNNSLEHFEGLESALAELSRITRMDGLLWGAVPDARYPDDRLYRFLYDGGGHVNQFSLDSFMSKVQANTDFRARKHKKLHTGFVYLNSDTVHSWHYLPRRIGRAFVCLRPRTLETLRRWMAFMVRHLDRRLGTDWSLYGWGVLFQKSHGESAVTAGQTVSLAGDFTVCCGCGRGYSSETLEELVNHRKRPPRFCCSWCGVEGTFVREKSQ